MVGWERNFPQLYTCQEAKLGPSSRRQIFPPTLPTDCCWGLKIIYQHDAVEYLVICNVGVRKVVGTDVEKTPLMIGAVATLSKIEDTILLEATWQYYNISLLTSLIGASLTVRRMATTYQNAIDSTSAYACKDTLTKLQGY